MKPFIIAAFLLLTTTLAHADVEKCYSLYMLENSDDPAYACVVFSPETGAAQLMNLYMINKELKEAIPLISTEQVVGYKGHLALHYFTIKGAGQLHTVSASQNYGSDRLMSLRVYSTADGHLQEAVEFAYRPKPKDGCGRGGRCR